MHIILSGKYASPVGQIGEELKRRWGSLGTAVYCHDAKGPVRLMCDALHTVAQQFGPIGESPDGDLFLQQALLDWGRERDLQFWGKLAKRSVDSVTSRWEELGLFHVVVIQNLCFQEDYRLFPRAFRVYVMPDASQKPHMIHGHHGSETALDSWVLESRTENFPVFDLVLRADEGTVEELSKAIFEGFNERFKSGFRNFFN
jgi:hypothetical protein